jgi:hypothetical protein
MRLRSVITAGGVSRPGSRRGPRPWWPWNRARPADAHPLLRNRRCLRVASRRAGGSRPGGILDLGGQRLRPPGVHRGYTRGTFPPWPASARPCRGSSGTRHRPAWTAAGTPGAPYGGKQRCAPTAASPRAAVRRIGLVPSKMVKILVVGAVSASQRPAGPAGISTSSARPVRDE